MAERPAAPVSALRFVVSTLVVSIGAGIVGVAIGWRGEVDERGEGPPRDLVVPTAEQRLAALRAAVAEWEPPPSDAADPAEWIAFECQVAFDFDRHGHGAEDGTPTDPVALATLLDLWSETAHRAGRGETRDALLQRARALDPEPQRDSIRAALLASGLAEVRMLAADVGTDALPPPTAVLLGLALWRCGEKADAIATWEASSLEHPAEPLVHLLLAWRLPAEGTAGAADAADDDARAARRHLLQARALLPGSARLRALAERAP